MDVIWKKICQQIEEWLESKKARFVWLCIAALFGLLFGLEIASYLSHIFFNNDPTLTNYLKPFSVSVFVLISLWIFRTYDARQQIYQNDQNDLVRGFDNLSSDNILQIDIGVDILITISKKISSFDGMINAAFIRRLKSLPASYKFNNRHEGESLNHPTDGVYLSYAQHIIRWLIEYKTRNKDVFYELDTLDLSYQEFAIGGENLINFKEFIGESQPYNLSLYCIIPFGIDFADLVIETNLPDSDFCIPHKTKGDRYDIMEYFEDDGAKSVSVSLVDPTKQFT